MKCDGMSFSLNKNSSSSVHVAFYLHLDDNIMVNIINMMITTFTKGGGG